MDKEIALSAKHISQSFIQEGERLEVLNDISFEVRRGEFYSVIGPSGCGKSTLLRILLGLTKPTAGEVNLAANVKAAMVFQNFALFPWLTVTENIGFGLKMAGVSIAEIKKQTNFYLKKLGLDGFANQHPKELSGGMKQRVGVARALAMNPQIIFFDEPFSALDVLTAKKLRDEILAIWQEQDLTVLMVTHQVDEAVEMSDKIIILSRQPGEIKEIVEVGLSRPRQKRSKLFYHLVDKLESQVI